MAAKQKSINLYMGSVVEDLATTLAARLNKPAAHPFLAPVVIVPNPNLRKWLQLKISACNGVVFNVGFDFLEKGVWRLLTRGEHSAPALLGISEIQLLVLFVLLQHTKSDPALLPIKKYLYNEEEPANGFWHKLWQLSGRLARYLRDYTYHRGEKKGMVDHWLQGKLVIDSGAGDMERCQQRIYFLIFGKDGLLDAFNKTQEPKRFLLRDLFGKYNSVLKNICLPEVYLFGFSHVSRLHTSILFEIANYTQLSVFHLNPYRKFYNEDPQEGELFAGDGLRDFTIEGRENSLLAQWGKAARDMLELFEEHRQRIVVSWVGDANKNEDRSVLHSFQQRILDPSSSEMHGDLKQDCSLQIVGCPGLHREIEMVRNSIIYNLQQDSELKLSDFAVLVTDMKAYRPMIHSIFSGQENAIPYNLSDSSAADESIYGAALLALFNLAVNGFSRKDVFALIFNPCFLSGVGITRREALVWLDWADRLNIFHERNSQTGGDTFSWGWGLRRLRLGTIMESPTDTDVSEHPGEFQGCQPYSDMNSADVDLVGRFSAIMEAMQGAVAEICEEKFYTEQWKDRLIAVIDSFLAVPADFPAEAYVRRLLLNDLTRLEAMVGANAQLTFALLVEFVKDNLAGIPAGRGSYLSGGVTISSLMPMRPIPFKIVYVLGLGEGKFPGYPDDSLLNLANIAPRSGDISFPDSNNYLFFETLLSVRKKLYLSYVSRDIQKSADFAPCSTLNQLVSFLEQDVIEGERFEICQLPLYGRSTLYLTTDKAEHPWSDLFINYSKIDRLLCVIELDKRRQLRLSDTQRIQYQSLLSALDEQPKQESSTEAVKRERGEVRLNELVRFILNPVDALVRRHLGMYDEEHVDKAIKEEEPFFLHFPANYHFPLMVLSRFVVTKGQLDIDRFAERYYTQLKFSGATPVNAFSENDFDQIMKELHVRLDAKKGKEPSLREVVTRNCEKPFFENPVVGGSYHAKQSSIRFEPTSFVAQRGIDVAISGEVPFLWQCEDGVAEFLVVTNSSQLQTKHWLGALFFYLLARTGYDRSLQEFAGKDCCQVSVSYKKGMHIFDFSVEVEQARDYIANTVDDFLEGSSFWDLPLDIILSKNVPSVATLHAHATVSEKEQYAKKVRDLSQDSVASFSNAPESDLLNLVELELPDDLYDIVLRRITPIFRDFMVEGKERARDK